MVGPAHVIDDPDRVAIVAISPGGSNIVLVRRYRHGIGSITTGLPGGEVDRPGGTPHLDLAGIAAWQEYRKSARRTRSAMELQRPSEREKTLAALAAAERAAKRGLREETGYAAGEWFCLLKSYPDPSRQTNAAYCFLAIGLDRVPTPLAVLADQVDDVIEYDFLMAMRLLQQGRLVMDALHAAALWSAATLIATDRSSRFGRLSTQLRHFFDGEDEVPGSEPFPAGRVSNCRSGRMKHV